MAKEFDIFLRRQVSECDIIVYSIPYRDGLTVANRLILESVLESYMLQKMIAVQTGSRLTAHIDDMLKLCKERLSVGIDIRQDAQFQVSYAFHPEDLVIHLGTKDVKMLANAFIEAKNDMLLGVDTLTANITTPFVMVNMPMLIRSDVNELKQSLIEAVTEAQITATVSDTHKTAHLETDAPTIVQAELADLCYQIYDTASTAIGIAQYVLGTELHHSFGFGNSMMSVGSAVSNTNAEKFEAFEQSVRVLADVTELALKYIAAQNQTVMQLRDARADLIRYRRWEEVDDLTLADIDNMTLYELYYVELT